MYVCMGNVWVISYTYSTLRMLVFRRKQSFGNIRQRATVFPIQPINRNTIHTYTHTYTVYKLKVCLVVGVQ